LYYNTYYKRIHITFFSLLFSFFSRYHILMEPIILASESPRRRDFFKLMGLPFTCVPAMIDETQQEGLEPRQFAEELAVKKASAIAGKMDGDKDAAVQWVFGADTIVVLDGKIFGKPADRADARRMLCGFAGKKHEVITAMALCNRQTGKTDCRSVSSEVEFAPLTDAEIEWYLDTGEWQGAAGAYQMQGLAGCLIKLINGSPSCVAGLPLYDFYVMLRDNGYHYGA
jgi:septum formation protein